MIFRLTVLFFVFVSFFNSYAQDNEESEAYPCTQILAKAEDIYEAGKLGMVAPMLKECIERNGFEKKEDLIKAHRLVILSYLYADKEVEAEESMLALLRTDPEFSPVKSDPAEFVELYADFRTNPIFAVGAVFGANIPQIVLLNSFGIHNTTNSSDKVYTPNIGFQAGIGLEINILPYLDIISQLLYTSHSFSIKTKLYSFTEQNLTETANYLEVPLSLRLFFTRSKLRPYFGAGGVYSGLLGAQGISVRTFPGGQAADITGQALDLSENRVTASVFLMGEVGVKYKVRTGLLGFSLRYQQPTGGYINTDKRYANAELIYRYGYIDDDFLVNRLSFLVGYSYAFYKPKKIKRPF